MGVILYKRDVLDRATTPPDIIVAEFAVNDYNEPTNGAAYKIQSTLYLDPI